MVRFLPLYQSHASSLNFHFQQWFHELDVRNVTFNQFVQKAGYELIKLSLQRMKRLTRDTERDLTTYPLIKWISASLFCFQPAAQAEFFKPIDFQGEFFNLQIRSPIAYAKHDIDCITVDFAGRSSDYERFAVGKGRSRDGVFEEMCFGTDLHLNVEIVGIYKQLENNNEGKKCTVYEGDNESEYGCLLKCRLNFIRHVCGCTAMTLRDFVDDEKELEEFPLCNSYENCTLLPTQLPVNETEEDCKKECYRSCTTVQWSISKDMSSSAAQLVNFSDGKEDTLEKSQKDPNVTSISFHWRTFEYIQTEQDWEYTWSSFMGNVGGILGCWLGLSVLGLIQGSFFIYDKCAAAHQKKRQEEDENEQAARMKAMDRKVSSNPLGSTSLSFNPFGDFVDETIAGVRKKSRQMSMGSSNDVEMNPNPSAG
uniref:Amiloride-sensitive sodium channel subunit alpha n=1 Tax=Bursaphelenchus xylophilus TaxID=6326 RepID=A0A1I7RIQ3_BURXY